MAEELLIAKGDLKHLGKNWNSGFYPRHPDIYSSFATPQDKNQFLAQDYNIISDFFDLYARTKVEYNI